MPPAPVTHLVRYAVVSSGAVEVGALRGGHVMPLEAPSTLSSLLTLGVEELRHVMERANGKPRSTSEISLLPPVDGDTEVWAAGVTYERSKAARAEESDVADVYDRVYDAPRPELFFKALPWQVVTDGETIARRRDSDNDTAEPELGVVVNRHAEVVGFTTCNDMSSRSIEGANPLYLPQAKVYLGSMGIAPGIRPVWEVPDPRALPVRMRVQRGTTTVFDGATSTAKLHREIDDLVSWLFRESEFPQGVVLSTGTGIVPPLDQPMMAGDVVTIEIDGVGTLRNEIVDGKAAMSWLSERRTDALARPAVPNTPAALAGSSS